MPAELIEGAREDMAKTVKDAGYVRPFGRKTSMREDLPPGYEAQVDFGQYKMEYV